MNDTGSQLKSEDWLSLGIGLIIFFLAAGPLAGMDLLGWSAKLQIWSNPLKMLAPVSKGYDISGFTALILTYLFVLALMSLGALVLRANLKRFVIGFTLVFWISYLCWIIGHFAYVGATPEQFEKLGINWSMNLTGEAGYILTLIAGLVAGNFFVGFSQKIQEALRPEWYIKTAIVVMGAALGVKAAESFGLATTILARGLCAIIEAYLLYWAVVYYIARRYFKFSREWAAPLASGISICGVSAAIATAAAIRARPVVPIMVSSLVVIFAVVELLLLPFLAQQYLYHEPMVAGAWMGLAVKTDGAGIASGAITDALIRAKALELEGIKYEEGWILMAATTTKIFIDIFIGIWTFLLAYIWTSAIDRKEGEELRGKELWQRFPKFVIGYVATFLIFLLLCMNDPAIIPSAKTGSEQANVYRQLFFSMTFFSIGAVSDFRKLWEEGIGKLAAVYVVSLFGFVIWVGLLISWFFFHGVKPPIVTG
jgi:uncharacterized membrane protein YadS